MDLFKIRTTGHTCSFLSGCQYLKVTVYGLSIAGFVVLGKHSSCLRIVHGLSAFSFKLLGFSNTAEVKCRNAHICVTLNLVKIYSYLNLDSVQDRCIAKGILVDHQSFCFHKFYRGKLIC